MYLEMANASILAHFPQHVNPNSETELLCTVGKRLACNSHGTLFYSKFGAWYGDTVFGCKKVKASVPISMARIYHSLALFFPRMYFL